MDCPTCKIVMDDVAWGETEGHVCSLCYSVWLNRQNNWHLMADSHLKPNKSRFREALALKCPECKAHKLQKVYAINQFEGITPHICMDCKGMFLNGIDFRSLKKRKQRHQQKPLQRKSEEMTNDDYYQRFEEDRNVEVGEYIFNIFTGLPVEINLPPQKPALMTYSLIAINVAIFLFFLTVEKTANTVIHAYGLIPSNHSPSAYVTAMFLHAGWAHIIGNMYFLYVFGDNVEDRLGKLKYLILYFVAGIIASMVYISGHSASTIPLVGASGAISGLMGAYLLACTKAKIGMVIFFIPIKIPAFFFFLFWVCYQFLLDGTNVAWEAHLGGFFAGLILYPILKSKL